ncbi:MAG: hypothetical protein QM572_05935, partial [Nocardioides sp.]|uniref:hypothetical protein n=1 Tax=Nocardioides sp. TaxID=35761 RepID=UPI0039E3F029
MRPTVADAMLTAPKVSPAEATVADLHALFADDHVHCAILVAGPAEGERVIAVVTPADLLGAPGQAPAAPLGRLA